MSKKYNVKDVKSIDGKRYDLFGLIGQKVTLDVDSLIISRPFKMVGDKLTITTKALLSKKENNGEICLATENALYYLY